MPSAIIIPVTGPILRRQVSGDKAMRKLVGGWLEAITLGSDATGIINEEGKLKGLPINGRATLICLELKAIYPTDCIVGTLLIFGPIDSNGDLTDAPLIEGLDDAQRK